MPKQVSGYVDQANDSARRVRVAVDEGHDEASRYLLEHLALYGADGFRDKDDLADLAERAIECEG